MTSQEHEDIIRLFGVVAEDLRCQIQQVAEGVANNGEALERFRVENAGELATVRAEMAAGFAAVRGETAREFAAVRGEAKAFRDETAREFATVRAEMSDGFAAVRAEMSGNRADRMRGTRPRSRRRPN
jgi:hypothetical protein